ncbi:MAG: response regulator [Candidatus Hydrogenedentes bacterium]|nr:response regulator [Candidatus Hydrogenedentota bacterium]
MKARILVVDDDPVSRKILSRHFSKVGFDVVSVESGKHALEELAGRRYDIVISDIVMPDMSGIDLLKSIRKEYQMVHVIMMTGVVTLDHALSCMRLGADTICFKPVNLGELDTAVEKAIDSIKRWLEILERMTAMKAASGGDA